MGSDDNNGPQEHDGRQEFKAPEEAIIRQEDERPVKTALRPEEVESRGDEAEYGKMKSADYDMDGDDNPDWDPAV